MFWAHSYLQLLRARYWKRSVLWNGKGLLCETSMRLASGHYLFMTCVYTDTSSPSGSCTNYDQRTRPIYCLFVLELKLWLLLSTPSMAMCIGPPMAALPPPTPSFSSPTDLLQRYEELSQTASDQALRRFLQTFQENHQQVYTCMCVIFRSCRHDVIITHLMASCVSLWRHDDVIG